MSWTTVSQPTTIKRKSDQLVTTINPGGGYESNTYDVFSGAIQAPATPTPYAFGRAPDDSLNKYNTATGQLNPNYNSNIGGTATGTPSPTPPTSTYAGVSVVDYLNSVGQASDFTSRAKLAVQKGITNYTGTADQNTQLLNLLKGGQSSSGISGTGNTSAQDVATLAALQNKLATTKDQLTQAQSLGYTTQQIQTDPTTGKVLPPSTETDTTKTDTTNTGNNIQTLIDNITKQETDYQDYLKGLPTAAQTYTDLSNQLGIPAKTAALTETNTQIATTQNAIDQLEKDINSRISGFGGKPITEALRSRELAVEQKPLNEQLTNLTRLAATQAPQVTSAQDQLTQMIALSNQDKTTQQAIAQAPLQLAESLLPSEISAAQYQSPQQQIANEIALQTQEKNLGLGTYAKATTTPDIKGGAGTGYYQYDSKTDTWKQVITPAPDTTTGTTPTSYKEWELAGGQIGTGKTYAQWVSKTGTNAYQTQLASTALDTATSLLPKVGATTVGAVGVTLSKIPGTPAANFAAELITLKANIAFSAITQMKAASKTGGALGQVSDIEEQMLSSSLGALSQAQSPAAFTAQLNKIIASLNRWNTAIVTYGTDSITGTTSSGNTYQ